MDLIQNYPLTKNIFYCDFCEYKTGNKKDYKKHVNTEKHKNNEKWYTSTGYKIPQNPNISQPENAFVCICGNQYKFKSGLYRHKKDCKNKLKKYKEEKEEKDVFMDLFKQQIIENAELKQFIMNQSKQLMDQNKQLIELSKGSTNNINNGTINNNNHFNLQLFLNETCKDAMTMQDFINSLQPTIHDLEETGRLGYSAGISRIIINGLKELDVSKRPIHCSDLKRETMFIKNSESWEKETDEKPTLIKAIKEVGKKNINNIFEWQKSNINYNHYDSKQNDLYLQIVTNSMSGGTEAEQNANYEKIVRNIAKETIIDKKHN
jgi:hypothetical protein